ncbi:PQ loop repeat protein [Histoplasma capsulatum G186AR]|uniref:PQ loop repeat protein n=2 Tax=Ajellomyces capsulatus TaxID=5037 RepID=C0NTN7_AJECG|nr:PQ loop repeat protein [Histoplasma capsulatum G186AR]EEH05398.1 PQ loop repeat protein [Histoplasma capsulatum G186AR]KAG5305234.1 PQ loop repeat protein [Histoplasma capsulatum]QSS76195.1 PQ loop repeat protein [Histoplasma capsulatum G186AR]
MTMWLTSLILNYGAPVFLVLSPLTSYSDQIYSIHKTKSSAGFSLDIPLIMLVASILKVFYWFGARYSNALLFQAIIMIGVQLVLLKVALDNRASAGVRDGIEHAPFSGQKAGVIGMNFSRPYNFWQWRANRPYWTFLSYFVVSLLVIHVVFQPISRSEHYVALLGFAGLGVEAFLPVPQIISNQRAQSCKGFRLSVLGSWILGDAMKMGYFFFTGDSVPWAFKLCGILQCCCDCYLGVQYWMFGHGVPVKHDAERVASANGFEHGNDRWDMKATDVRLS